MQIFSLSLSFSLSFLALSLSSTAARVRVLAPIYRNFDDRLRGAGVCVCVCVCGPENAHLTRSVALNDSYSVRDGLTVRLVAVAAASYRAGGGGCWCCGCCGCCCRCCCCCNCYCGRCCRCCCCCVCAWYVQSPSVFPELNVRAAFVQVASTVTRQCFPP